MITDRPLNMDSRDYMPETYNMPATFKVQALTEKYIRATILEDFLTETFGMPYKDWLKVVRSLLMGGSSSFRD